MEPGAAKSGLFRNLLVILFFGVFVLIGRFAYVVTVTGESCNRGDFCFFTLPETLNFIVAGSGPGASAIGVIDAVPRDNRRRDLYTSKDWIKSVNYYSSIFQDLISDGYLSPNSKSLCVETAIGQEVFALREIGVEDSIGISRKAAKPLVIPGEGHRTPFGNNTFDFIFSGAAKLEIAANPAEFASEITRTLKPEGFLVAHIKSRDTYSFNSFLNLFSSFELVKFRDIDGFDSSIPYIREIVMKKKSGILVSSDSETDNQCSVPEHKLDLIRNAEALITVEPLKPWVTLKRNIQNIKYLPSMADLSFKSRYVYVDVGARSYGSSIGSWFRKQYPKQNKTFDVYAIEADKTFHDEYKSKKKITLLPYAAWIRNETLSFQVNGDSSHRGMGRIQPNAAASGNVDRIQGFDLAEWLKKTVTEKDFVVMKMDVEGTEFDLIPRLFETGAICLIDEIFLECHYNRWQKCCPGERSPKYEKSYEQCLDLFTSLRERGVLVHQWW